MAVAADCTERESQLFDSKPLSEDDLPELLDLLHDVAHKWERIAIYLRLKTGVIDVIKCKGTEPEDKLMEVIRRWLSKVTPTPTVISLVEALKKPYIGEEKTALAILKHFYPHRQLQVALLKSMSTSDTHDQIVAQHTSERLDRSDSSPAAVPIDTITIKHTSTQVNIPDFQGDLMAKQNGQQNYDDLFDASSVELRSPYENLDFKKMTDDDQQSLMGRLTRDYKCITGSYSKLILYVIQSLKTQAVTPKQLSTVLMNLSAFPVQKHKPAALPLLTDNLETIRESENVDDVFYILRSYGSFFDCHVIKHIVHSSLCTDEDREELQKYENELDIYCRRSVFECPHIESLDPKFQSFVMKVDDVVLNSLEMKAIHAFRVELAEACGLESHTLRLCSVEEGCLQLTFQIPPCVVDFVCPLTADQQLALKGLGVLKLVCGDYVFDSSQFKTENSECVWIKLLGQCTYGEDCYFDHNINPISTPAFGSLPECATPEAVKQLPTTGHTTDGKVYVIATSSGLNKQMMIVGEDENTVEFAKTEIQKQILSAKPDVQFTRLKYIYFHPDGIERPVLYVFRKQEHKENRFQLEQIKPKEPVKEMTVENFDHLPSKHIIPAYSRLSRYKKIVYPVQLRRDYRDNILEQLSHSLRWMHENQLTPRIVGRLGKFTWRECLDDECFDVEKLVTLSKELEATDTQETQPSSSLPSSSTYFLEVPPPSKPQPTARSLKCYFFNTEVDRSEAIALKACYQQLGIKEDTYTLTLREKQGEESRQVKIKFDGVNTRPRIIYTRKLVSSGQSKVRVLFDILLLHRKYDIRVSLADFKTVDDPSVTQFITSTIEMPEPGVLHYNPTLSQEKWFLSYIRYHESEMFELQDSYIVEISAVSDYGIDLPGDAERIISPDDFQRRHELELRSNSPALNPTLIPRNQDQATGWTPDGIIEDFQKSGFLQMMEDLNAQMERLC